MSVRVMTSVWDRFPGTGTELLTMLALADWCNDEGGSLYPSIAAVARKIRTSESQARRILHKLIAAGWISVVGNEAGGAPGATRHYRLNVAKLAETGSADARGSVGARGRTGARDGSHGCAETGSTHASLTVNRSISEPSDTPHSPPEGGEPCGDDPEPTKRRARKTPIPADFGITDAVRAWAEEKGHGQLEARLEHFRDQAVAKDYRYADWDAAFRNAIKGDWAKLNGGGGTARASRFTNFETMDHSAPEGIRS